MNLRILKKLSKRVAPLVAELIKDPEALFKAEKNYNYTNTGRHDRKHLERNHSKHGDLLSHRDIKTKVRNGEGFVLLSQRYIHPWKNTEMVGWTSGYYEPEWEEETTWDYFSVHVFNGIGCYEAIPGTEDEDGYPNFDWILSRKLNNPSDYLKAFSELQAKEEQSQ
ncbi:hypothetical protein [Acinetobacter higginsii]|uniref:hypothetical protein n=1 Tax=Acinetobacter higginsii TaxID=70347 RepID=UPI0026762005|nr:hypothetical protein [Acinetobacter higginsii]MDO3665317.1 hypothetical protein [Acinetobacter higginsii]